MHICYTILRGDTMQCENIFCIYWDKNECTLKEISLDDQGTCLECIYVNIDEEILKEEREKILKRLERQ